MAQFRRIFSFFVGDEIDKGTFSTIRLAYHNTTLKPCALKLISKSRLKRKNMGKSMIFAETVIGPLLKNRNVVRLIDCVETKKSIFLFLELCSEGNLLDISTRLSIEQKIQITCQIINGVEYLHNNFICHRDLKLENILLHRGIAKICDFGFSAFCFGKKNTGKCGSIEYVAPEVVSKSKYNGIMADMWSLGVLIYKLFANEVHEIKRIDFTKVPPQIAEVIQKLLVNDPIKRLNIHQLKGEFQKISEAANLNMSDSMNNSVDELDDSDLSVHKRRVLKVEENNDIENESDMCVFELIKNKDDIVSRLCEILELTRSEVFNELSKEEMNEAKVIGKLINDYSDSTNHNKALIKKFHKNSEKSFSVPHISNFNKNEIKELTRNVDNNKLNEEEQNQHRENDNELVSLGEQVFNDKNVNQIFKALRKILFKHNFCVSTKPTSSSTVVILNTIEGDVKLEMNCMNGENDHSCKMTLAAPPNFLSTAREVIEEIQSIH